MKIKSLRQAKNIKGKIVFLRADLNVSIKNNRVEDDFKAQVLAPTIRYLARYKCRIVIASHLGRPNGKKIKKYSLKPLVASLKKVIGKKISFVNDCVGKKVEDAIGAMKEGDILLLENLRYYKEEKKNDLMFAKSLAGLADFYVNDAFAVCHRSDASVSAIKKYINTYAGLLLEKEVINLDKAANKPKKPLVVMVGGAKMSTKVPLVKALYKGAEKVLVGGAAANVFLKARGYEIGKSLSDEESMKQIKKLKANNILLPVDVVTVKGSLAKVRNLKKMKITVKNINNVVKSDLIVDIGPKTIRLYASCIKKAKTIIWNGPFGMYEHKQFKHGTLMVARVVASRASGRAYGVVGGGATVDALRMTKMMNYVDWVSTGGGASLAYLGKQKMPGLKGIVSN